MVYAFMIAFGIIVFLFGYSVGHNLSISKLDGDICIVSDKEDKEDYAFLRMKGSMDEIKDKPYVQLNVTCLGSRD